MRFSGIRAGLLLMGLLLLVLPARAQIFLDMAITPFAQTGAAGTQQTWDVTLTNNTGGAVSVHLTGYSPGFPVTPDIDITTGLLPAGAISLDDGQSYALSGYMTTSIHPDAAAGVYDALAEIAYDATDSSGATFLDTTASADWRLTATAAVPEPTSLALALLAPPLWLALRRKR